MNEKYDLAAMLREIADDPSLSGTKNKKLSQNDIEEMIKGKIKTAQARVEQTEREDG